MNSIDRKRVERVRRTLEVSEAVDYGAIGLAGALAEVGRLRAAVALLLRVIEEPDRGLPGDPVDVLADMVRGLAGRLGERDAPWDGEPEPGGSVASVCEQSRGEVRIRLAAAIYRDVSDGER